MNLSPEQIRWILIYIFVLVLSVAVHEFGHAFMANRLGDDTPRRQGRVTLNPLAHADPIGTLLLPLVSSVYAAMNGAVGGGGFGWGRPVQWTPSRIRRGTSMTKATILVAVAGPFMNLCLAILTAIVHTILAWKGVVHYGSEPNRILGFIVMTNFILMFFNLLPIPPLDGGHVLQSFMPYRHREKFDSFAKYGPFVVLGFMLIPEMQAVFVIPARFCATHLYSLLSHIVGM